MEDMIAINIVIADRSYRLKAKPQDEEMIRKTAKLINEKITEFKTAFAGKDMQDYVSMVLLWYAVESADPNNHLVTQNEAGKEVAGIEALLDKALATA